MKKKRKIRVMVVAGGSGGHIFPAMGFCEELDELRLSGNVEIYFVSSCRQEVLKSIPVIYNPVYFKEDRRLFALCKFLIRSVFVLLKIQPDIIFGFGGYLSVPFICMGKLIGAKVFIHEQNVVPGKANIFLAMFADRIAVSFARTKDFFSGHGKKVILTRYPLRKSLCRVSKRQAFDFFGFQEGLFTVLVMGGSQGARRVNDFFLEALKENKNLERYQILHLCGVNDAGRLKNEYLRIPVKSKVFAFLPEMNYAYSVADIVLSRAGASSIAEIIHFGLPSVLIPYPFAGAHQVENARVLSGKGASFFLEENQVTPALISGLLDLFASDCVKRETMAFHAASAFEDKDVVRLSQIIFL